MRHIPYFEQYNSDLMDFHIRNYEKTDRESVMDLCVDAFSNVMNPIEIPDYLDSVTNYDISFVVEHNNKVVGVYLLGDKQISDVIEFEEANIVYIDLEKFKSMNGVEGIALVVDDKYKNIGLGSLMKDHTRTLGFDYICGVMYKDLGNKAHWSKRRILAAENDDVYVMVETFNK
jgi:GNAT superfamily N-acetyltransferase